MFLTKIEARRSSQQVLNDMTQDQLKKIALAPKDDPKVDDWKRKQAIRRIKDADFLLKLLGKYKKETSYSDDIIETLVGANGGYSRQHNDPPLVTDPKVLEELGGKYVGDWHYHDGIGNNVLDQIQRAYPKDKWQALLKRWAKDASSLYTKEYALYHTGSDKALKELMLETRFDEIKLALAKKFDDPKLMKALLEGEYTDHDVAKVAAKKIKGDEEFFKSLLTKRKKGYGHRQYDNSMLVDFIKDQNFLLKLATTSDETDVVSAAIKKLGPKKLKELYFDIGVPKKKGDAVRGWRSEQWNRVKEQILEGNKDDQEFIYQVILKDPKDSFRKQAVKFLTDDKLATKLLNMPRLKQDVRYALIQKTNDPEMHKRFALDDPSDDIRKLAIQRPHQDQNLYYEYLKRHSIHHNNWNARDLIKFVTDQDVLEKIASDNQIAAKPREEAMNRLKSLDARMRVYDKTPASSPVKTEFLSDVLNFRQVDDEGYEVEDEEDEQGNKLPSPNEQKKVEWAKKQLEQEDDGQRQRNLIDHIPDQDWLSDYVLKNGAKLNKGAREQIYRHVEKPEPALKLVRQEPDDGLRHTLYQHLDAKGAKELLDEGFEVNPKLRGALLLHLTQDEREQYIENEEDSQVLKLIGRGASPEAANKIALKLKDRESQELAMLLNPPAEMTKKAGAEWWTAFERQRRYSDEDTSIDGRDIKPQINQVYPWLPTPGQAFFADKIAPKLAAEALLSATDSDLRSKFYSAIAKDQRLLVDTILADQSDSKRRAARLVKDENLATELATKTTDPEVRKAVLLKIRPEALQADWVPNMILQLGGLSGYPRAHTVSGPLLLRAYELATAPDDKKFLMDLLPDRYKPEQHRKPPEFEKARKGHGGDAKPIPTTIPAPKQQLLRLLLQHARP